MIIQAEYNNKQFAILLVLDMQESILEDYVICYEFHDLNREEQSIIKQQEDNLLFAIVDGNLSEGTIEIVDYSNDDEIVLGEYKFKIEER